MSSFGGVKPRRKFFRQRIARILALLLVACALGLGLLVWLDVKPGTIAFELAKALLQVSVVVLIGALISLGTSDYQSMLNSRRELKLRSDEVLRRFLEDAVRGYHDVKRARRVMRARLNASDGKHAIGTDLYDDQMEVINDAQLTFERLKLLVRGLPDERVTRADLRLNIKIIEEALHELVEEYESNRPYMSQGADPNPIGKLAKLNWFLGENSDDFNHKIGDPFDAVLEELEGAMLKPLPES